MNISLELTRISILHCTHILQLLLKNSEKSYCTSVLQAVPAIYSCICTSKCLPSMSPKYILSTWIKFRVRNNDIMKVRRGNTQYPTPLQIKLFKHNAKQIILELNTIKIQGMQNLVTKLFIKFTSTTAQKYTVSRNLLF